MDYILKKFEESISFAEGFNISSRDFHRARLEYVLFFILGYLWNKNFNSLDAETKEYILKIIYKPTIGQIVELARILDKENKEIFNNKNISESINKYPSLRNKKIGHGFIFPSDETNFISLIDGLYKNIINSDFFQKDFDIILVLDFSDEIYKGIIYKSDGKIDIWQCAKDINKFEINSVYFSYELNEYFRLSPFIHIVSNIPPTSSEFYLFSNIQEKLLGRIRYIKLFDAGEKELNWKEFESLVLERDDIKKKSINGTITNIYENNYKKYIDIGIGKQIENFVLRNRASVCATVWGHGGVGKTATVQYVCENLTKMKNKKFDYIIFLSAKDRRYNYYTGQIEEIRERVTSLSDILSIINKIIFNEDSTEENKILEDFKGKMLLVIDDFETFSIEEKEHIKNFILKLDINYHKVIITTRANLIIGQEIQTSELSDDLTIKFLLEVINNELPKIYQKVVKELNNKKEEFIKRIHLITSGRPLFILQLAYIIGQKGSLSEAINYNIKDTKEARNFLYDRIYDNYLSDIAKNIFVVISLLVNDDDLANLVDKIKYILNLEYEEDKFLKGIKELVKLRIIKLDDESKFFEVYSKDILSIMTEEFHKRPDNFKSMVIQRFNQIGQDRSLDNELALLKNADRSRLSRNEEEVINNYRQILNRPTSPQDIKLKAVLNLAAYLIVDRGKRGKALKLLDEFSYLFKKDGIFTKMYATYYWANGTITDKHKSIKILLNYISNNKRFKDDLDLEIEGLLLTYRSVMLVNKWLETNTKKKYNEYTSQEFKEIREEEKRECYDIYKRNGIPLFRYVSKHKIGEFSSGARQNVIAGLYQFINVCFRIQKFETAKEICEYMLYMAPPHFHPQFKKKLKRIEEILNS